MTKGIYSIRANTFVKFDTDTERVDPIADYPTRVHDVYVVPEDMQITVYDREEKTKVLDAKKGDILVVFYRYDDYPNITILIKSEEWLTNIRTWEADQQRQKEEWAAKKAGTRSTEVVEDSPNGNN